MTIAIDSSSKTRSLICNGTNNGTMSVTIAAGDNRLLVVLLYERSGTLQTLTVTYDSSAMTLAGQQDETSTTNDISCKIYYMIAPPTGTKTLSVSCTNSTQIEAVAVAFTGVLQTSPESTEDGDSSTGGTNPTLNITPGEDNCLIVGGVLHEANNALTCNEGTSLYDTDQGAWVTSSAYIIQTTAAASSMDWTAGTSNNYAAFGQSFKAAAAATVVTPTAAACIASTSAPTVNLGSISATPTAAASIASTTAPTAVLGSQSVTPTASAAIASTSAPTVALGSLILTPADECEAIALVTNPSIVLGSVAAQPVAAGSIARVADPTPLLESIAVTPVVAGCIASCTDPTIGSVTTYVTPVESACIVSVSSPTVLFGSLSLTPIAAGAIAATVAPFVIEGGGAGATFPQKMWQLYFWD